MNKPKAKKATVKNANSEPPAERIDARLQELGDWRGETLARVRVLIHQADPEVLEEWKWAKSTSPGVPVWSHDGILCTGETYKSVVKLTFAKGASLPDPSGLFNSSLEGNVRRAIDLREGDRLNEQAFKALIRAAVALNTSKKPPPSAPRTGKLEGEAAVLAKIVQMPAPYRAIGQRLHEIITASAPALAPRLWYGMPAYAKHGKVICFFRTDKYLTLGFTEDARLAGEDGDSPQLLPSAYSIRQPLDPATEAKLAALVSQAAS